MFSTKSFFRKNGLSENIFWYLARTKKSLTAKIIGDEIPSQVSKILVTCTRFLPIWPESGGNGYILASFTEIWSLNSCGLVPDSGIDQILACFAGIWRSDAKILELLTVDSGYQ
jgi:hypothetical protein